MQIIFEGPDGSGKTSISERVAEILKVERIKASVLHDDQKTFDTTLEELGVMVFSQELVIRDRWYYPSDTIYNPIIVNKPSAFCEADITLIEHHLKMVPALFLIVTADEEVLAKRLSIRGDDYIKSDHLSPILSGYQSFIDSTGVSYQIIDTTDIDIDTAVEQAILHIKAFYRERRGMEYGCSDNSSN